MRGLLRQSGSRKAASAAASSRAASSGMKWPPGNLLTERSAAQLRQTDCVRELGLVLADDDQRRGGDASAGQAIIGVMLAVKMEARAVVGAHRIDR